MRDIKFRGFSVYENKWVYGDGVNIDDNITSLIVPYGVCFETEDIEEGSMGQYTGLKDKNGKEIYEGDIVNYFRNELAEIKFINGCFAIESKHYIDYFNEIVAEIEIVGNIYENKDLLK